MFLLSFLLVILMAFLVGLGIKKTKKAQKAKMGAKSKNRHQKQKWTPKKQKTAGKTIKKRR